MLSEYLKERFIEISSDMKDWAYLAFDKMAIDLKSKGSYDFAAQSLHDKTIFKRKVSHPKYGEKELSFILSFDPDEIKFTRGAYFENKIMVPVSKKLYDKIWKFAHRQGTKEELESLRIDLIEEREKITKAIYHELVHAFDPKVEPGVIKDKQKRTSELHDKFEKAKNEFLKTKTDEAKKYMLSIQDEIRKLPWEVEANMSAEASKRVENGLKTMSAIELLAKLPSLKPESLLEKFYGKDQNTWKRYLLHLYRIINNEIKKDK